MKYLLTIFLALLALAPVRAWSLGLDPGPDSGLDPSVLSHPPVDAWPTYNGEYSGRRFSTLNKINDQNVKALSLAWMYQLPRSGDAPGGRLAGTPLVVNGVMYITSPDKVWALDARTARELWAYTWTSKGGIHLGNRGVGISGNSLYFETPDCNLVSLNLADGKKRWSQPICDLDQMYYASVAPLVVKNHIITGVSGDDLDEPRRDRRHGLRDREGPGRDSRSSCDHSLRNGLRPSQAQLFFPGAGAKTYQREAGASGGRGFGLNQFDRGHMAA